MKRTHTIELAALLTASVAFACTDDDVVEPTARASELAAIAAPDESWISVAGRVVAAGPDRFTLDHGGGTIVVEVDDWDPFHEGSAVRVDDEVIVDGHVDDDEHEERKIEASSVYVERLGAEIHALGIDEEDYPAISLLDFDARVEVEGVVTTVGEAGFAVETAEGVELEVDVAELGYDPIAPQASRADARYFQVEPGDEVRVGGQLETGILEGLTLRADSVVALRTISSEAPASPS